MKTHKCIQKVKEEFPFPYYVENTFSEAVEDIALTISKYISPGGRILDFGSGPCDKTAVIQCMGYNCSAFDDLADEWHRKDDNLEKIIAFSNRYKIDFRLAENGYLPFPRESYDMVMAHHVLEHIHDSPRELLNDLAELLKPCGLLFITVPSAVNVRKRISVLFGNTNLPPFNSYYWYPGPWRGHVREYVKRDLELLAKYLGFEVLELRSCHHMLFVVPSRIRWIYLLMTRMFPGWRDSWMLVAKKPLAWTPRRKLTL